MLKFRVSHGGRAYDVEAEAGWNLGDLASELGRVCNVLPATVKLLRPKAKHPVVPGETPHKLLSQVGEHVEGTRSPDIRVFHVRELIGGLLMALSRLMQVGGSRYCAAAKKLCSQGCRTATG